MHRPIIAALLLLQVRTADPIQRGLKESDFPRTIHVVDNVYTYEDLHAGDEKFTTTDMFVVTSDGVVVADGQGSPAATKGLVDAIAKVTPKPIKYVIIASDHGDHTAGNASFPPDVRYVVHKNSKAILDAARGGWTPPEDRTEVIDGRKMIALGGEEIGVAFLGRAHTGGDLVVYVPSEKAAANGDILFKSMVGWQGDAFPNEHPATLDALKKLDLDLILPGHGDHIQGKANIDAAIANMQAYLREEWRQASEAKKAGASADDALNFSTT